ncbi:UDP-glucoronosyl and UDP-glucosyl transferase [Ostertagia ostertagi]
MDLPIWDYRMRATMNIMTTLLVGTCRKVVENKDFLDWLVSQKFDLAFAYMADACPIGLIHYAKIPSWIWLSSAGLIDFAAYYMGVPMVPSYIPPIAMESTDEMNFYERTKSLIGQLLTVYIWRRTYADQETAIFREIDPNFPHIVDITEHCPLVMVNSNELYELPRPTLAKIVNIGGIGMQLNDTRPLPPEFHRIAENCEGLVVFSLGSIAPSHLMPETWKKAFLEAFTRFKNLHFVFRYEGSDLNGKAGLVCKNFPLGKKGSALETFWKDRPTVNSDSVISDRLPPNVHLFKWIPQADLLRHPKTVAFITHGGYNSLQEVITAGVPLITIALWGDQPRNAKLGSKAWNRCEPPKRRHNYSRNVKRLSLMVKKQPVSPAHRLVAWAEFVAEFKTLDNLVPAGTKLNFIQYHSLDVIAFLSTVVLLVIFIY